MALGGMQTRPHRCTLHRKRDSSSQASPKYQHIQPCDNLKPWVFHLSYRPSLLGKGEQSSLGQELLRPQASKTQPKTTNILKGEGMEVLSLICNFSERYTSHLCSSRSQDGKRHYKGHYTYLKALGFSSRKWNNDHHSELLLRD